VSSSGPERPQADQRDTAERAGRRCPWVDGGHGLAKDIVQRGFLVLAALLRSGPMRSDLPAQTGGPCYGNHTLQQWPGLLEIGAVRAPRPSAALARTARPGSGRAWFSSPTFLSGAFWIDAYEASVLAGGDGVTPDQDSDNDNKIADPKVVGCPCGNLGLRFSTRTAGKRARS